jgi:hypothetical protein
VLAPDGDTYFMAFFSQSIYNEKGKEWNAQIFNGLVIRIIMFLQQIL